MTACSMMTRGTGRSEKSRTVRRRAMSMRKVSARASISGSGRASKRSGTAACGWVMGGSDRG